MNDFDSLRKLQEALVTRSEEIQRALNPMGDMLKVLSDDEHRRREMLGALSRVPTTLSAILDGFHGTIESAIVAGREQREWQKLLGAVEQRSLVPALEFRALQLPAQLWQSSLIQVLEGMNSIRLPEMHPLLADHLLRPYNEYSRFARETVARIELASDPIENAALSGSLVLAEAQIAAAADLMQETLEEAQEESPLGEPPVFTLLESQQAELLVGAGIPEDTNYEILLSLSPSAHLAQIARTIAQLIVECNQLARTAGTPEVFKPTTALLEAQNNLGWIVADDKALLGSVVDYLYIMLYEAAGKDDLRYLVFVDEADCAVIWTIKHLRNKWLRHDPDHGDERKIVKSWQSLQASLSMLGISTIPTERAEFRQVQSRLLREVQQFLRHPKTQMKLKVGP